MNDTDPRNEGRISYEEFVKAVMNKRNQEEPSSEQELLDAFIALGGEENGDGSVDASKLI